MKFFRYEQSHSHQREVQRFTPKFHPDSVLMTPFYEKSLFNVQKVTDSVESSLNRCPFPKQTPVYFPALKVFYVQPVSVSNQLKLQQLNIVMNLSKLQNSCLPGTVQVEQEHFRDLHTKNFQKYHKFMCVQNCVTCCCSRCI